MKKKVSYRPGSIIDRPFVESYAEKAGLLKTRKSDRRFLLYLSGSITNDPDYSVKFELAETILKARGHITINPLRIGHSGTWEQFLAADLSVLTELGGYARLLRGSLSPFLPTDVFLLPAVVILDDMGGSRGRDLEIAFGEARGVPNLCIWNLLGMEKVEWDMTVTDAVLKKKEAEKCSTD